MEKEQLSFEENDLEDCLADIDDIWMLPMSDAEPVFFVSMTTRSDSIQAGSSCSTSHMYAWRCPSTCCFVLLTVSQKLTLTFSCTPSLSLYQTRFGILLIAYAQEIVQKNRTLETIFTAIDCGVLCHSLDGSRLILPIICSTFPSLCRTRYSVLTLSPSLLS